mmetsp:Transcript_22982/g.58370  ORF Transcript_22982/g.58370 Transcript_22982/m.58370 type:complete len:231 (-) Transcript_22982:260-952(-)
MLARRPRTSTSPALRPSSMQVAHTPAKTQMGWGQGVCPRSVKRNLRRVTRKTIFPFFVPSRMRSGKIEARSRANVCASSVRATRPPRSPSRSTSYAPRGRGPLTCSGSRARRLRSRTHASQTTHSPRETPSARGPTRSAPTFQKRVTTPRETTRDRSSACVALARCSCMCPTPPCWKWRTSRRMSNSTAARGTRAGHSSSLTAQAGNQASWSWRTWTRWWRWSATDPQAS